MKRINFVGCGNLGKTLGGLFAQHDVFDVGGILTRSVETAEGAAAFMGAGTPAEDYDALPRAEVTLIAVPDDAIEAVASEMAAANVVRPGDVVYHASGSLPSTVLVPLSAQGARVASVHPVQSFADPKQALEAFAGTWCGVEGDPQAVDLLKPAFESIGGRTFDLNAEQKLTYHAAAVFACNYLASLMEIGFLCYERAGVDRRQAAEVVAPLVRQTLENVLERGPARALTGPIARGDAALVGRQGEALASWRKDVGEAYRVLGQFAVELASETGRTPAEALKRVSAALESVNQGRGG